MSVVGKGSLSLRKKDVKESKAIGVGFRKLQFAHQATIGDTGINLASISAPSAMASLGFTNPSTADLLSANLLFYQKNLVLISSVKGILVNQLSYTISNSSRISFNGWTAEDGEIFIGTLDPVAKTELQVVDATPIIATGLLLDGTTDFNVGTPFEVDKYPLMQQGAILVFRNGLQQFRNSNNAASPADGNYYEVQTGSGLGTVIRFNNAASGSDDNIMAVSNGLLAERPDGSMMAVIENLAGQLDQVIPTVAALAGVPETDFQAAPNNVDLKQFGDQVLDHEQRLDNYVGENLSALRQYSLTVTGTGWATTRAIAVPYRTLDGTWRLRFNIHGALTATSSPSISIADVVFKSGFTQACVVADNNAATNWSRCTTTAGSGTLSSTHSANVTAISYSGDVELDSKPAFVP